MIDQQEETEMTIGKRIDAARVARGLSITQLSRRMSVQVKTAKKWLQDLSEPRANQLTMLAGILGVPVLWILSGTKIEGEEPLEGVSRIDSITNKLDRLLSTHQGTAITIMELQQEFNNLKSQIDQEPEYTQVSLKRASVQ